MATPPKKLGILSTIDLTKSAHDLFNDIERGYGVNHADTNHHHNVGRQDLKNKRDDLIRQKNCAILATIGGLYASAETDGFSDNVPMVSLVGEVPTLPGTANASEACPWKVSTRPRCEDSILWTTKA